MGLGRAVGRLWGACLEWVVGLLRHLMLRRREEPISQWAVTVAQSRDSVRPRTSLRLAASGSHRPTPKVRPAVPIPALALALRLARALALALARALGLGLARRRSSRGRAVVSQRRGGVMGRRRRRKLRLVISTMRIGRRARGAALEEAT